MTHGIKNNTKLPFVPIFAPVNATFDYLINLLFFDLTVHLSTYCSPITSPKHVAESSELIFFLNLVDYCLYFVF